MTLTEFLSARIAEDEGVARRYLAEKVATYDERDHGECHLRVLADCEAKRQIVELCQYATVSGELSDGAVLVCEATAAFLALPYADHPDYREEWKP